jgi:two-component system, chemotaxis family, response regulator Rcp1
MSIEILLVEDSASDADLLIETLSDSEILSTIHIAKDGVEAIAFLHQKGKYAAAPRPDLILLDLNLPRKDGREVLAEVKTDPDLGKIPIIVLTTSAADEDIFQAYKLHANSYITKPVGLEEFVHIVKAIELFWLATAKLPPHPD